MDDSCVGSVHFENGSKAGDAFSSRFEGGPMAAEQKTRTLLAAETLPLSNSCEEEKLEGSSDEGFVLPIVHPLFEPAVALAANNYLKGQEEQLKLFLARIVDLEKVLFHTRHVLQEREQTVVKERTLHGSTFTMAAAARFMRFALDTLRSSHSSVGRPQSISVARTGSDSFLWLVPCLDNVNACFFSPTKPI